MWASLQNVCLFPQVRCKCNFIHKKYSGNNVRKVSKIPLLCNHHIEELSPSERFAPSPIALRLHYSNKEPMALSQSRETRGGSGDDSVGSMWVTAAGNHVLWQWQPASLVKQSTKWFGLERALKTKCIGRVTSHQIRTSSNLALNTSRVGTLIASLGNLCILWEKDSFPGTSVCLCTSSHQTKCIFIPIESS